MQLFKSVRCPLCRQQGRAQLLGIAEDTGALQFETECCGVLIPSQPAVKPAQQESVSHA